MIFQNFFGRLIGKKIAKQLDLKEGPMDNTKKWYQSKNVWTGIVTALVGTYEVVRLSVAPQFGWPMPEIPPIIITILGAAGIYTRVVASAKIG